MGLLRDDELRALAGAETAAFPGPIPTQIWAQFEQTGRIEWVTDLAEIPARYGVTNVYGDLGQIFAQSTVADQLARISRGEVGYVLSELSRRVSRGNYHLRGLWRVARSRA
ncbi:MAG TPA: hypothetical protein VGD07_13150 [Methylomirabilota bacterium]